MHASGKLEQRDAVVHEAIVGAGQCLQIARAAGTLLAPHLRHAVVEIQRHPAIEPVHVERIDPLLQPMSLAAQSSDGLLPVALLVTKAFLQRTPDEIEDFRIDVEPT